MSAINVEMAAAMPWLTAKPCSIWEVSGVYRDGTFDGCLARVLPPTVTGNDEVIFEVLIYLSPTPVPASSITRARELLLVEASDPRDAYYERDQATIDRAWEAP